MFEERLEDLLRVQLATTGATALCITRRVGSLEEHQCRSKLGQGAFLLASFAQPESGHQHPTRRELLERAAREMRALFRDTSAKTWPEMRFPDAEVAARDPRHLILARIQQFLQALVDSSSMHQEVLVLRGTLVASAHPMDAYEEAQLDLLCRQLDKASDAAVGTAHGELARDGLYAHSFWYGAALIGFCRGEYSVDFMRHRSRIVARELVGLLEMLDGGPDKPVKQAPPP